MKRTIFLKVSLLTLLTLSVISLSSCSKDDEPKSESPVAIGNGVIVIGDNQYNVRYGHLRSEINYNGLREYRFRFRSFIINEKENSLISYPPNSYIAFSVYFEVAPDKDLKSGEEWTISSDNYGFSFYKYADESLSVDFDFTYHPTLMNARIPNTARIIGFPGDLTIKRIGDNYFISIDYLVGALFYYEDGNPVDSKWETGRFSWNGPLNIVDNLF